VLQSQGINAARAESGVARQNRRRKEAVSLILPFAVSAMKEQSAPR
jgi:hypothetical protein